jgi:hypothetical protein
MRAYGLSFATITSDRKMLTCNSIQTLRTVGSRPTSRFIEPFADVDIHVRNRSPPTENLCGN